MDYVAGRHDIAFKVNPTTIISQFPTVNLLEVYFSKDILYDAVGYNLRIRLIIYDENGSLVKKEEKKASNYREQVEFLINLPEGKYTAISICDVIRSANNYEYWTLTDENNISTLKLLGNGNASGNQGRLVGINSSDFIVTANDIIQYDLKPIGALMWTRFEKIHIDLRNVLKEMSGEDIDVDQIGFYSYSYAGTINIDRMGNGIPSFRSDDGYVYPIISFSPKDIKESYYNDIGVLFPTTKYSTFFIGISTKDNYVYKLAGDTIYDDILAGEQYFTGMDLSVRKFHWEKIIPRDNASSVNLKLDNSTERKTFLPIKAEKQVIRIAEVIN
jgi:hypothetical protein